MSRCCLIHVDCGGVAAVLHDAPRRGAIVAASQVAMPAVELGQVLVCMSCENPVDVGRLQPERWAK